MNQQDDQARIIELQMARAAIDAELVQLGAPTSPAKWVTLSAAAWHCGRHVDRMAQLVRRHGLGRRVGKAWMVDMVRVEAWLQGRPYEPIRDENV